MQVCFSSEKRHILQQFKTKNDHCYKCYFMSELNPRYQIYMHCRQTDANQNNILLTTHKAVDKHKNIRVILRKIIICFLGKSLSSRLRLIFLSIENMA